MILGVDGSDGRSELLRKLTRRRDGELARRDDVETVEGAVDGSRRPALFWHAGLDRKA